MGQVPTDDVIADVPRWEKAAFPCKAGARKVKKTESQKGELTEGLQNFHQLRARDASCDNRGRFEPRV